MNRVRTTQKCSWCRNEFQGLAFSKFCGNRCKQADKYNRKKFAALEAKIAKA